MGRAVTVQAGQYPGAQVRISLPEPAWEGKDGIGTGVWLTAVYLSPRAREPRIVLARHSIWQQRTGGIRGTYYVMYTPDDAEYPSVLGTLDRLGIEIPAALETAEPL